MRGCSDQTCGKETYPLREEVLAKGVGGCERPAIKRSPTTGGDGTGCEPQRDTMGSATGFTKHPGGVRWPELQTGVKSIALVHQLLGRSVRAAVQLAILRS